MRRITRGIAGTSVAAVLTLTAWTPAHADPGHDKHGAHVIGLQIGCDNGQAYASVMNGKGKLSAIHDVDSTRVLVPAAVSKALVTVLDADLDVVDQWTTPARAKHSMLKHHRKALTTCDVVGFSPQNDGGTITVQATMLAKVTRSH